MSLLCRGYLRGTAVMDVKGMWWFITGGNVRSALLWTVTARQCTEPSVTACKFRAFPEVIPVSALHLWGCRGCMLCNLVKGTVITRVKIRTRCAVSLRGASQWHKSSDGSEEDGAAGSSPLLLAKQNEWVGLVTKSLQSDSTLFFSPPCGSHRVQSEVWRAGTTHARNPRVRGAFSRKSSALRVYARHKQTGMAEVDDTAQAARPSWYGGLERGFLYRRTNYIHEMNCSEVGSHLYSRMCCAGRSDHCAALSIAQWL